jgi:hypothetical protein
MVKKKFRALVIQEGKSTISFLEKSQNLLNQMACVGLGTTKRRWCTSLEHYLEIIQSI